MAQRLRDHEMPPEDAKLQPTADERQQLLAWIDAGLAASDCGGQRDPGRVTIRRLNRNEYNNTIRDLLGVDFHPADDFPSDDVGYGFDNIGDVLALPPILLEKYLTAAEKITQRALGTDQVNLVGDEVEGGHTLDNGMRIPGLRRPGQRQAAHVRRGALYPARPRLRPAGRRRTGADGHAARRQAGAHARRPRRRRPAATLRSLGHQQGWPAHGLGLVSQRLLSSRRSLAQRSQPGRGRPGADGPLPGQLPADHSPRTHARRTRCSWPAS